MGQATSSWKRFERHSNGLNEYKGLSKTAIVLVGTPEISLVKANNDVSDLGKYFMQM